MRCPGGPAMVTGCPCPPGWPAAPPVTSTLAEAAHGHGPFRSLVGQGGEGYLVGVTGASWLLGVRAPDRSRAILVVTVDGELAVAVRDAVPRGNGRRSRRSVR